MRTTISIVRADASVVTVLVMKRTITGSTSSQTLVSDAQIRSKTRMCRYGLKYGKKRFSRYFVDIGFCSMYRIVLSAAASETRHVCRNYITSIEERNQLI